MLNLPRDLQNIVQSMVPGRERIEMWMIEHNITKRNSKAVRNQLLTWYMDDRTNTEPTHRTYLDVHDAPNEAARRDRVGRVHLSVGRVCSRWLVK